MTEERGCGLKRERGYENKWRQEDEREDERGREDNDEQDMMEM